MYSSYHFSASSTQIYLSISLSLSGYSLLSVYRPTFVCILNDTSNANDDLAPAQVSALQNKNERKEKRSDVLIICFLFSFQLFSYCIHEIPLAWTPLLCPTSFYTHTLHTFKLIWYDMICSLRLSCRVHNSHRTTRCSDCADVLIRFRPSLKWYDLVGWMDV